MVNICILDDDRIPAEQLHRVIRNYFVQRKAACTVDLFSDGDGLLKTLERAEMHYHIYFLDILMPGMNGIQVAQEIRRKDSEAHIIFLTSSPEYAIDGYEVRAHSYLLKPLQIEKIHATLSKILGMQEIPSAKQLQLRKNGVMRHIPYHNIVYIEVRRNKLVVVLDTGEEMETYSTMSEVAELLKDEEFFTRPHRSFLINMQFIREFSSTAVRLQPDYCIPVSRTYVATMKQDYAAFFNKDNLT